MNIAVRDEEAYLAARDATHQELLVYAAKSSGQSPLAIQRDFQRVNASESKINFVEYVRFGMHRLERFTLEERETFISNDLHWPITHTCNDSGWTKAAEDKAVADMMMRSAGVRVPETIAVIDTSSRLYPGLEKIATPDALRAVLTAHSDTRIFGKIVGGMVSFGAFRVEEADDTGLRIAGHEATLDYATFMTDFVGDNPYILQRELKNHATLDGYAGALATVRMVNLVSEAGVDTPAAVIKMPQGDNIADAFWRPGNLACDIDVATGRIQSVAMRGIETAYLDDHPEKAGLMGLQLPDWQDLLALNARAANVYAPIRYQSTDIALTQDGPVIVELNYGGGFDLPQYASGRGLLTPSVRAFFESHGYSFAPKEPAKKKSGLFSFKR